MRIDKGQNTNFDLIFRIMREEYSRTGLDPKSTKYAAKTALSGSEFVETLLRNGSNDFSGAYVYDLKVVGIDLSDANLKGAWLSGVQIPYSNLQGSEIDCAHISGNLKGVDLRHSIIRRSLMEGDFSAADFSYSIIHRSEIVGVFAKTKMQGANVIDTRIVENKSWAWGAVRLH